MNAESDGLLAQWKLLGNIVKAKWSKGLDLKIAYAVIQNYYRIHRNSRISVSFLEVATGASRTRIIASLGKLVENGVFTVARKGLGKRPTAYSLNFAFGSEAPSSVESDTSSNPGSGDVSDTTTSVESDTARPSSIVESDTQTFLQDRLTSRSTERRNQDAPAVLPGCGLTPAPAHAVDPKKANSPFDELWLAYSRKEKRADARDAYNALAPDPAQHRDIVEAAEAWAANYATIGTQTKYKKYLHNWLKGECWLEDLPSAYENAKDAAIAKAREKGPAVELDEPNELMADNDKVGLSPKTPLGRHVVEIIGSHMFSTGNFDKDYTTLRFDYRIIGGKHDGKQFSHKFFYVCDDRDVQSAGQRLFRKIEIGCGIESVDDTADLHGKSLTATVTKGGRIAFEPL